MLLEHRVVELDLEVDLEAIERIEPRPLVAVIDLQAFLDADEALGRRCSSMPADCSRNTNGPALPSMIGTSAALRSTKALSMPRPGERREQMLDGGDLRRRPCQAWCRAWCRRHSRRCARMSTGDRQVGAAEHDARIRGAGPQRHQTFLPVCRPTPVARIEFFSVRCPAFATRRPPGQAMCR